MKHLFDDIAADFDLAALSAELALTPDLPEYAEFGELLAEANRIARPRAALLELPILGRTHDQLTVPGGVFTSRLLVENCAGEKLILYAASCGPELDALRRPDDDPLRIFWLETLKAAALWRAFSVLKLELDRLDIPDLKSLDPTDSGTWPVEGLVDLFAVMPGATRDFLQIELTENMYMLPNKSRLGVFFQAADANFSPCVHCSMRERCAGHRKLPGMG
jgi:hypothetical protein